MHELTSDISVSVFDFSYLAFVCFLTVGTYAYTFG